MKTVKAGSQFSLAGNVEVFTFPSHLIKNYNDYLLLAGSPAFPTFGIQQARKIAIDHSIGFNKIPNVGLGFILDFLLQEDPTKSAPTSITHASAGSGTNVADAADQDLQTPIGRLAVTRWYKVGYVAHIDIFCTDVDLNGTWNELGLHNAASGIDTIYARKVISTFTKDNTKTAIIAWSITPTAV